MSPMWGKASQRLFDVVTLRLWRAKWLRHFRPVKPGIMAQISISETRLAMSYRECAMTPIRRELGSTRDQLLLVRTQSGRTK